MTNKEKTITIEELKCLQAFKLTCKKYNLEKTYHIGRYAENKLCISKEKDNWTVYIAEKVNRDDKYFFKNCEEACIHLLRILSDLDDVKKHSILTFKELLHNNATNLQTPKKRVRNIKNN